MAKTLTIELEDGQMGRLSKLSEELGKTPDETVALLIEEQLREAEFRYLEFRNSPIGRQPYLHGTRLPVWQVVKLIRAYKGDLPAVADHLSCPLQHIEAAEQYAQAHAQEVEHEIALSSPSYEELKRILPNLELLPVDV